MQILVNGEPRLLEQSLSVSDLIPHLGLDPRMVAIEYNGEILHRQHWATTQVAAGDRFEIVTMVGGG
jgi:sulfur carrier protein